MNSFNKDFIPQPQGGTMSGHFPIIDPGTFRLKARIQFADRTASDTITAEALQGNPELKE